MAAAYARIPSASPAPAVDPAAVLDRAGGRQWIDEKGRWLISLSFRYIKAQSVLSAIAELEASAQRDAIVIWHRRWE